MKRDTGLSSHDLLWDEDREGRSRTRDSFAVSTNESRDLRVATSLFSQLGTAWLCREQIRSVTCSVCLGVLTPERASGGQLDQQQKPDPPP
ncbi:hypothetical protein VZT92_003349 [Zoarces viviparus]|uniref:Uncharacterized protein n=1 Tax=Zoarces viviparus TaxID=48416 RepID=A0AAW1G0X2_ZOAVI